LISAPQPAIPIAGGTDLLLDLEQVRHSPIHTLVDLSAIPELTAIDERNGAVFVGAAAPLNRIARHPLVAQHAQALVEACDLVGGPQVRNVATLGGNVAHALPAADGTIALLALDAEAEIASSSGERRVLLSELFLGPGKSSLKRGEELLIGFYLPLLKANQSSSFKRIMRPQGVALPILNLAIRLSRNADAIAEIRIAVGPGAAIPWRAEQAEKALTAAKYDEQSIHAAQEALLAHAGFRSSPRRATSEYRRHLVGALFRETLQAAWQRAGEPL
jgi:carbon-monoxide dehydrogenase medium subunit